jgi:AraC-like DNA-binding protein
MADDVDTVTSWGYRGHGERAKRQPGPPSAVTNWCPRATTGVTLLCRHHHTHFAQKAGPARSTDGLPEWEMARARKRLYTSELQVAEIGGGVGYPDPIYFSRQCGHVHGMSPRDCRLHRHG